MLDKFDDAYLGAATLNQVLATYIESPASTEAVANSIAPPPNAADQWTMFENKLGYYDKVKMRIGGARIPVMPPGDKIHMEAVNRAIQDPTYFRNGFLRGFASSVGISFEQLSKNFSDANYSAARAALLDVWQEIVRLRFWFGQHVLSLIYGAVVEEALVKGRTDVPADLLARYPFAEYRTAWCGCLWTGPGFPQIDPEKEAKAAKMLLEMKVESREEIIAQRGRDIEDVFSEIGHERSMAEEIGFTLDPLAPGTPGAEDATIDPDGGGNSKKKPKTGTSQQRDGDGDGIVDEENQ
jgi:lambda family phage portal protein